MEEVKIHIVGDLNPIKHTIREHTTSEELVIELCKSFKIGPIARHLFALRLKSTKVWLSASHTVKDTKLKHGIEFRIRYNIPDLNRLKKIDVPAYDFYFKQVRHDILHNKIAEFDYDKHMDKLIGLSVTDMYRATMEDGLTKEQVGKQYRKFVPNEAIKKHSFFVKKPVIKYLNNIKLEGRDALFVKTIYLDQFRSLAPHYLTETFNALVIENDAYCPITMAVDPFHEQYPGIRIKQENQEQEWSHMCTINDLCYINSRNNGTVEISRKNGIPVYITFKTQPELLSFVSLLDGYYRLMVKWIFNLCVDVPVPSLHKLLTYKCHGPVSGEFSYRKLSEKRNNEPGCYILRESDVSYDSFYLDVCTKHRKPITYKIQMTGDGGYKLHNENTCYPTLTQLVADHKAPNGNIVLTECLPPSEFDESSLLLCKIENRPYKGQYKSDEEQPTTWTPLCIDSRSLMVFKNMPKEGKNPLTVVYPSVWCNKNHKVNVAIKVLKEKHQEKHLTEFLMLTSRWGFVNSNAIVKLHGVTLANPISMVMQHLPLGQLHTYLSNAQNRANIKEVDLVEASTYLANALWYMEEAGFIHGNIRCRKLLVSNHTDNSFVVKLCDPGLNIPFTDHDAHWIPPEYYGDMNKARNSIMADVWAFGTTLWEIFSFGKSPPNADLNTIEKFYMRKKTLPRPAGCPDSIYYLMLDCWNLDPDMRKKPQAAMRDVNQVLYQVYNSRQAHSYASIIPSSEIHTDCSGSEKSSSDDLDCSIFSQLTLNTFLGDTEDSTDDNSSALGDDSTSTGCSDDLSSQNSINYQVYRCTTDKSEMMAMVSQEDFYFDGGSISSMQSIFELDKEWNLILTGRIGEGFYGEVYKGRLEHMYNEKNHQLVAVKKMKACALSTNTKIDFDREIAIMLKLQHPNIVEIKGVVRDPELCLVLEFIEHGSLQCYLKIHRDRLSAKHLLKFALDVAVGMCYLCEQKMVHRDLAARNILVVNEYSVKISDFGLARFVDNNNYYQFKTERDLPINWYAPESIEYGKFSQRSDVWSYGVTLFEMFSYADDPKLPIEDQTQESICTALKNGIRLPCPETCPQYIYTNIMSPCWKYEAGKRPTFKQLSIVIGQIFAPN